MLIRARHLTLLSISLALLFAGCDLAPSPDAPKAQPAPSRPAAALRLIVVDDSALAEAVKRLRGEWRARSGGALEVSQLTGEELLKSETIDADGVIYPARYLGALAERELIAETRPSIVEREGFDAADVFSLVRLEACRWGEKQMALPLGSPVFVLYYRADLLDKLQREPPTTWRQYAQLTKFLADRENLGDAAPPEDQPWYGTIEPWGEGWAARTLLARAAPYVRHRNHYSTLFKIDTMEPLVAGPGFVRALEELVAARKSSGAPLTDPAGARRAIHAGRAALAISWPTAAADTALDESAERELALGIAELPGAEQVYDIGQAKWERRERDDDGRTPLLGVAGRLASLTQSSNNAADAQRLLAWLAGPEISGQISPDSPAATLFRHSQTTRPSRWVESTLAPAAAQQYVDAVQLTLERTGELSVPRLPGGDRYLAALDAAVQKALTGEATPEAALREAADRWRQITAELGVDAQRQAYRRGLGL
jgi:multiple sugar transport system substrate-binding protein